MKQQSNKIECPNCGYEIDVNDILYHQVDAELRKKYQEELASEKSKFQQQFNSLNEQKEIFENDKKNQQQLIDKSIQDGINQKTTELKAKIQTEVAEQQSAAIKSLQEELTEKSSQLKEFNQAKSDIERLKREKDELKSQIEADAEKKLNQQLAVEREKIKKSEEDRAQLKLSEKEQVITQLHEQLKAAQRKAEQGSMQLQGEVQELAIEDWLAEQFPLDTIEEIKKGARGADCLQIVNTTSRHHCGTIYYESKRSKSFQPAWIEKFKNDIREKNADIGVLVTESMPTDMDRMGLRDGVWICSFDEFKALCQVLRESLIRLSTAVATQENKGDKMGMLYDFLTSNEFRLQIEAIVEGFSQMQSDLESEKRAMTGIWKKREKQLQKVLLNTNHMYSSIKGIAGNAVQSIPSLELSIEDSDSD